MSPSINKIKALFITRNKEYYRDKASFGWNIMFPFFIVIGFYFIFSGDEDDLFKVGLVENSVKLEQEFFQLDYVNWVSSVKEADGQEKIRKHKIDLLIDTRSEPIRYWVNSTSKNAYLLEKMLNSMVDKKLVKEELNQKEISYMDWVIPGIIAMNIMFNCLWGIGYVMVRYRQNGYLKRLKATPIKAYHYLIAQLLSRYVVASMVTLVVFFGTKWTVGFTMKGSYFDLFLAYTLGIFCIMSLGLVVAARTTSKEFADGMLNIFSWPMMILSGVWFAIDESNEVVTTLAQVLPLTHLVDSTRAIMTEGVGLVDIKLNLIVMGVIAVSFITIASLIFKWDKES